MRTVPLLLSSLLPLLVCFLGLQTTESQLVPSVSDDQASVLKDFLSYMSKINVGFKSPQDKQDAEKNFKQSRQLVKAHNSKPSNYKVKLGKFAHVNSAKLKKMRLGMKKARVNKGRRLKSAPKFNITRHRGALLRAQNRAKGRGKRQTDALQSLLALFQSFGGGLGGLGNLGSLGQGFDLSQIFAGGGATNGLSSLFGGGGSLPNPFGGGGGGLIPTQRPVSPTRKPSDRTDTTDNTGSLSPATLDWRQHNYVRSVKDQGICGSCYTFSSVAAIEGQMVGCFGDTTDLSEQNPLACATSYGAGGCDGGDPGQVFDYAKDHGIESDSAYPYVNKDSEALIGTCNAVPSLAHPKSFVASHDLVPEGDEEAVKKALNVGPLSACMDAGSSEFQQYDSGVFDGPCTQEVNHAVLIVGYGTDPVAGDYWLVKNSWGTDWGENGYFRLKRNAGNKCGIASYVQYPTLKDC